MKRILLIILILLTLTACDSTNTDNVILIFDDTETRKLQYVGNDWWNVTTNVVQIYEDTNTHKLYWSEDGSTFNKYIIGKNHLNRDEWGTAAELSKASEKYGITLNKQ